MTIEHADASRVEIRAATETTFGQNPATSTQSVEGATDAAPIVIDITNHGRSTGEVVEVASVGGNTAANGIWEIEVIDVDTFALIGSQGNDTYTSGGTVRTAAFALRNTSESFKYNVEKKKSAERRPDRQSPKQVVIGENAAGDLGFELSYKEYDFLFASALQNLWTVYGHRGQGDAFTGTVSDGNTLTAGDAPTGGSAFTRLQKGQWVNLSGLSTASNNKLVQISKTTAPTSTVLVFEGTPLADGSMGASCRVNGSRLTNGVIPRHWALEKDFTDIDQIFPYNGLIVDGCDLNIAQGDILTGTFRFMGKKGGAAIPSTAFTTAKTPNTYEQMNSITGISNLQRDGATLTESLMSITLRMSNQARGRRAIGNRGPVSYGYGDLLISGTMEAYLEDGTRMTKYVDNSAFSVTMAALDDDGNGYVFTLPAARFTDANPNGTSGNQDVTDPGAFECEFDEAAAAGYNKMIFIDRVGAAV